MPISDVADTVGPAVEAPVVPEPPPPPTGKKARAKTKGRAKAKAGGKNKAKGGSKQARTPREVQPPQAAPPATAAPAVPTDWTNRQGPLVTLAQHCRLLADPSRLAILAMLAQNEEEGMSVTRICTALGQSQPAVSHHLALLRVGGLVEYQRHGKENLYRVSLDGLLAPLVAFLHNQSVTTLKINNSGFKTTYTHE